MKVVYN